MRFVRSLLFQVAFYGFLIFAMLSAAPLLPFRGITRRATASCCRGIVRLTRWTAGAGLEVRGRENLPPGGVLIAAKHQSAYETFALLTVFPDAVFVLKQELTDIPLFGRFLKQMGMVPIDRSGGAAALISMTKAVSAAAEAGHPVIIFPEGTRKQPGAEPDYKTGVYLLYRATGLSCVPLALNSGLFWPRKGFWRYPGTIVFEILPALPPQMPKRDFLSGLQTAIETASDRLVAETIAADPSRRALLAERDDLES